MCIYVYICCEHEVYIRILQFLSFRINYHARRSFSTSSLVARISTACPCAEGIKGRRAAAGVTKFRNDNYYVTVYTYRSIISPILFRVFRLSHVSVHTQNPDFRILYYTKPILPLQRPLNKSRRKSAHTRCNVGYSLALLSSPLLP